MKKPRTLFLSLRAKLFVLLALFLLVMLLGQNWLSQEHSDRIMSQYQSHIMGTVERVYSQSLDGRVTVAAEQVEALNLLLRGDDLDALANQLEQSWQSLRLTWSWLGVRLQDARGRLLFEAGQLDKLELGFPPEPRASLQCRQLCMLTVAVPVLSRSGQPGTLTITESLAPLLSDLHQTLPVDLLLLAPNHSRASLNSLRHPQLWNLSFRSGTPNPQVMRLMMALSRDWLPQQLLEGRLYGFEGRQWLVWWHPLPSLEQGGLLIAMDVNQQIAASRAYKAKLTWLGLALGIFSCSWLLWLAWRMAARLSQQAKVLPSLAHHPEALAGQQRQPQLLCDELDLLEEAEFELARRLVELDRQVQQRTSELEHHIKFDPLTGLASRSLIDSELYRRLEHLPAEEKLALVFMDINDFKQVNDSLGHEQGDRLLQILAQRLSHVGQQEELIGRFAGDDFVVLKQCRESSELDELSRRLREIVKEPVQLGERLYGINVTLGIAVAEGPEMSPGELLKRADMALHHAKASKASISYFNRDMEERLNARISLDHDLDAAFSEQQFMLYLQPQYQLSNGELHGFEALIRWRHPKQGIVSPGNFIPALEQSERIVELGFWTIEEALSMLARLEAGGLHGCHMAVNLSPRQFLDASLPAFIDTALRRHGLLPGQLELEVTETSFIGRFGPAIDALNAIKATGVRVAIDDFGTGYSSLSYLRQLPFDVVKIDRSFVATLGQDDTSSKIVTSLIELLHNLGATVVAEGVETQAQLRLLKAFDCDLAQGYLLGKPMDETSLIRLLSGNISSLPILAGKVGNQA
ncbi:EAL domain-containing protein [Gallaecimonas sp. GXIMD4217]|uniref:putative bifunctional diguanylate cyclase/phosphodiesterase n=1 Tax=Gallaecimonas sp. GXIMD4217 TaxID=3131927 RepID=UPI00311AE85B